MSRGRTLDYHVNQRVLEDALNTIFSSHGTKNARKEVSVRYPLTGKFLEVDVWYPDLLLCFEFQDDYHYQPTWYHQHSLATVKEKDDIKRSLLLQRGETLILVPCWWDGSPTSLSGTIHFHRPDLLAGDEKNSNQMMIPPNPSLHLFTETRLMLASFPSSPDLIDVSEENDWWLGEKYDGIRCFWNPNEKKMYSRHGALIDVHPSVGISFGHVVVLDGEIWCGRRFFHEAKFLIEAAIDKPDWTLFRIVCFDEASQLMADEPFERRYSFILSHLHPGHPTAIVAARLMCTDTRLMTYSLKQVVSEGGEGIILRRPLSRYCAGRSDDLIKIKQDSQADEEALVVEAEEDGSLLLQLRDRTRVYVSKTDCVLHRRAVCGDIVSFTYDNTPVAQSDTAATETYRREGEKHTPPSSLTVYRFRDDLLWDDVSPSPSLPSKYFLNERFQTLVDVVPKGNEKENRSNMRTRLEALARDRGGDPLQPSHWYQANSQTFMQHSVVRQFVQKHYDNSWTTALKNLFPELNLDLSKFQYTKVPVEERKMFFDDFAKARGFDPLVADNWYTVSPHSLLKYTEFKTIIKYYTVLSKCLMHLYPDIGLQKSKFKMPVRDRKNYFDKFSKTQGFDPLVPENWYSASFNSLSKSQEYKEILKYYRDLPGCLMHLYPNIGLQKMKFSTMPMRDRRLIFDNFARLNGFDPLVSYNWYTISTRSLSQFKDYKTILQYYGRSLLDCLMHLYPNIGLRKSQFDKPQERRMFFDKLATAYGFDPLAPDNWYNVPVQIVSQYWGYKMILAYYNSELAACLMHLYPDIGIEREKFATNPSVATNLQGRIFFDRFAATHGFDPLVAANWYKVTYHSLSKHQEYNETIQQFKGKLSDCLTHLYPDIGLEESEFSPVILRTPHKSYFDDFAAAQGFNPLIPNNWYNVPFSQGHGTVLKYHRGKLSECLMQLYPDIGLQRSGFKQRG